MLYVIRDSHGRFPPIEAFCKKMDTNCDGVMTILGDAGINFGSEFLNKEKKNYLKNLSIILSCIRGSRENGPYTIPTYKENIWHGIIVYYEEYANLLFAEDREALDLNEKQNIVMGGAYSIEKMMRIAYGYG